MTNKSDFKVGDKVRHGSRDWYQKCEIISIEDGCNGLIKVLCQDSPIYDVEDLRCTIKGFGQSISTFCPQDIRKIK